MGENAEKNLPSYEVHDYTGQQVETKRKVFEKQEDETLLMKEETVREDAGYMVYFPNGHSVRVRNKKELERLNIKPGKAKIVNMDTAEEAEGASAEGQLKKLVETNTKGNDKPVLAKSDSSETKTKTDGGKK